MKILQVNCVYNTGSTGKIMYDIHTELKASGYESVICYGRGVKTQDNGVYKTCGELYSKLNNLRTRFTGIMYGGCFFSTNKLISIIKKEKPDVVHLHCINGYFVNIYRLVSWLKNNKIKTVLTLHAEFMHTANCGHAYECEKWKNGCGGCPVFKKETKSLFLDGTSRSFEKMKKAFNDFDEDIIVTSVSPWLKGRAEQSPILMGNKHKVVLNGLDEKIFYPRNKEVFQVNKKTVLFVTPIFSLNKENPKGGYYVVELAKRMPDVNFAIIGCRERLEGLPENIINIGRVDDQNKLAEYYSAADLTLIVSRRETFSMVLAESLCCGTPVVGFKAGGPETIAIDEYCNFADYGDVANLQNLVEKALSLNYNSNAIAQEAIEKYKKQKMVAGYIDVYSSLLGE